MTDQVQDATVVETPVVPHVPTSLEVIATQKATFTTQLEGIRKDMVKLQQDFDAKKTLALKLEGALESLEILKSSLSK